VTLNLIKAPLCAGLVLFATSAVWADGTVYTMTNALGNNQIAVYHRFANGNLNPIPIQTISTGGGGSGLQLSAVDSLGSEGSLQLDQVHSLLFAVNTETTAANNGAGAYNSDCHQGTITSFAVGSDGTLTFVDRVFSRGLYPNSLTVRRQFLSDLLYVLNAGGGETGVCDEQPSTASVPNITGFVVDLFGHIVPLGSVQPIDPGPSAGTGVNCPDAAGFAALTGAPAADFQCGLNPPSFPRSPAQVGFTPDGTQLIVTVKGTNTIYAFPVDILGRADNPTVMHAAGPALPTYFGFTFDKNEHLLVTEAFGAATSIPMGAAGAVSSFVDGRGNLTAISSHVGDGGTAACWIALEPETGKWAFVSNNLSASISSYSVAGSGRVTLLGGTAASVSGPNDLGTVVEDGGSYLYVVEAGTGMIVAFKVNLANGSLTALTGSNTLPGFPGSSFPQGLAVY
jgi:6-phosphogluconolactonase